MTPERGTLAAAPAAAPVGLARIARPRVVVVGSLNVDLVTYTTRVPGPGETLIGGEFRMFLGGKGANQAVMARLLGADVAMVGSVGTDAYGDLYLARLAELGIDASHVGRVEGSTGVAPIWVEPGGTNRIIVVAGANDRITREDAVAALEVLDAAGAVVGQLEIPQPVTAAAFGVARRRGARTVLNPAPAHDLLPELLAATDWLIPNEGELGALAGTGDDTGDGALRACAERLGTRLVVTLGARGAALVGLDGDVHRVPAVPVGAVDSTGAGDAFVGAFAYGLAAGLDDLAAVRLGIRCASDSVTRPGAQASFPDAERARELATIG